MENDVRQYIEFIGIWISLLAAVGALIVNLSTRRKIKADTQKLYDEMLSSALEREKKLKDHIQCLEERIDEQSKLITSLKKENESKDRKIKALQAAIQTLRTKRR